MNIITRDSLIDSLFDTYYDKKGTSDLMKTDIYEEKDNYVMELDIHGFKKEDINVDYEDGYITITAKKKNDEEENNKDYIRRERVYGEYSRSFYVGKIKEEDIKAKFDNGILKLNVPKECQNNNIKQIPIE